MSTVMASRSYMSRREAEQQSFSLPVALFVPLAALLLQMLLPRVSSRFAILDLPLIVTLFFAVSRRNAIVGTTTGATIGLLQDALSSTAIGLNGMAKSLIGYAAASLGSRIDVDNNATRTLLTFGFCLLQSILIYLIERHLLGLVGFRMSWLHELLRAVINTVVALPIYLALDRTRKES